jgi:hypothetical protein
MLCGKYIVIMLLVRLMFFVLFSIRGELLELYVIMKLIPTLSAVLGDTFATLFDSAVFIITLIYTWDTFRLLSKMSEKDTPTLSQLIITQGM